MTAKGEHTSHHVVYDDSISTQQDIAQDNLLHNHNTDYVINTPYVRKDSSTGNPYLRTQQYNMPHKNYHQKNDMQISIDAVYVSSQADIKAEYDAVWQKWSKPMKLAWYQTLPILHHESPQQDIATLQDALCLDEDTAFYDQVEAIIKPYISDEQALILESLDKDLSDKEQDAMIDSFSALALSRAAIIEDIFAHLPSKAINELDALEDALSYHEIHQEPQTPLQAALPFLTHEQQVSIIALIEQLETYLHQPLNADNIGVIDHLHKTLWGTWQACWAHKDIRDKITIDSYFNVRVLTPEQEKRKNILSGLTGWFT